MTSAAAAGLAAKRRPFDRPRSIEENAQLMTWMELAMAATIPFLKREAHFDPDDLKVISTALDDVCKALKIDGDANTVSRSQAGGAPSAQLSRCEGLRSVCGCAGLIEHSWCG
jgi:hypothetical protein